MNDNQSGNQTSSQTNPGPGNGVQNNTPTTPTPSYNTSYNYSQPYITPSSVANQTFNGQSAGGYSMPDLTGVSQSQNQNSQNFNQNIANQTAAFQGAYNSAAQSLPTYQQLQNNANAQYNVQPLATNAANLQATLLQIPQTYLNATSGSDTNANQYMQLVGQKQWELSPQATAAEAQAQAAQGLANNMVQAGVNNEAQMLSPYSNTVGLVQGQQAGAYANFTAEQQSQLQALQAMVQAGTQLSANQASQLASLQNAQTQANAMVAAAQAQAQGSVAAAQAGQQYKLVSPSQGVWNAATGTVSQPYNSSAPQIPGSANYSY